MTRVNEGSHSFTCHPHVYPQVYYGKSHRAYSPQLHSITALLLVPIFRPTEWRAELIWVAGYIQK